MFKADKYYNYQGITELLEFWKSEHPDIFDYEVIGQSYEKRDIYATIISRDINNHRNKPAYYIDANHHAGEVTGSTTALHTINYLLNNQEDKKIDYLLNNYTFYILPRIAVDGSEFYLNSPYNLRSSVKEYSPSLDKGLVQEDIDDNGKILQMRFKSKIGNYKISDKDPRIMIKRQPDDFQGDFYELLTEGLIEDYDGVEIKEERSKWTLDFNRNYPQDWNPELIQKGAGPYPLSESETRSVADFILEHTNIAGAMSYHTYGGVILRPYCTKADKEMDKEDFESFRQLGEIGEEITNYPCWSIFEKFTVDKNNPSAGSFIDFVYDYLGITCFATELWDIKNEAGINKLTFEERSKQTAKEKEEEELKLLKYSDDNFQGELFIDWYPVEHPQLGQIELGGWYNKFSFQNPPVKLLEDICHKNMLFTLSHALAMPKLDIEVMSKIKVRDKIYKIDLALINKGSLSTAGSALAEKNGMYNKIKIKIEGDIKTIGKDEIELDSLGPYGKKKLSFVVEVYDPKEVKVLVESKRAGTLTKVIDLKNI